jgi:hypothetical protein
VFIDDVIKRPYYELEKIITFSGIKMPDRPRIIKSGKKLRTLLKNNNDFSQYPNASAIKARIGAATFQAAVEALGEELTGTGYLTK